MCSAPGSMRRASCLATRHVACRASYAPRRTLPAWKRSAAWRARLRMPPSLNKSTWDPSPRSSATRAAAATPRPPSLGKAVAGGPRRAGSPLSASDDCLRRNIVQHVATPHTAARAGGRAPVTMNGNVERCRWSDRVALRVARAHLSQRVKPSSQNGSAALRARLFQNTGALPNGVSTPSRRRHGEKL